jgi:hypothetical protein
VPAPYPVAFARRRSLSPARSARPCSETVKTPDRHFNITAKRLALDFYQFIRAQSFVCKAFGRQYRVSREFAEIDITYKCNLKCINCNRSCTQAPDNTEMSVDTLERFLAQSIKENIIWKRIRLLGGEPTLHSRFFRLIEMLSQYQNDHNPLVRLVLCTNFYGEAVHRVLEKLPENIIIKSTLKTSRINLFKPFNSAPCDRFINYFSDYACGCRIIEECGLGLTPSGYYMCAIAGGIDRIFGYRLGRPDLPKPGDGLTDQMMAFCRVCGHFGFQWPTKRIRISRTWRAAYRQHKNGAGQDD